MFSAFSAGKKVSFSPLFPNFFNPIFFPPNHFHRNTYRKFFLLTLSCFNRHKNKIEGTMNLENASIANRQSITNSAELR